MRVRPLIAILAFLLALAAAAPASASPAAAVDDASCAGEAAVASAETAHHAGLVVVFDTDRIETLCIAFTEETITGEELLARSGLPVVFSGFGGLGAGVCRIDDVGCRDPADCFCQCRGAGCSYWAYYGLEDGVWHYLPVGSAQRRLHDGDTDAWVWGSGRDRPATGKPCPDATPTPPRLQQPPASVGTSGPTATAAAVASESGVVARPSATSGATAIVVATATPAAAEVRHNDGAPADDAARDVAAGDDGSGRAPTGLIVFGAVAVALAALIAALVVRRRFLG